jgi:hypothetical protein
MVHMTSSSRVLLLPDAAKAVTGPHASKVRHYRLARVRLAERRGELPPRHAHLLKAHD